MTVLMCVSVLGVTWLLALLMGYNMGEAAGLLAGSQTISAVIGVAEDTMANMGLDEAQRQSYINIIPVSVCRNLHFRYRRLGLGAIVHRTENAGRTG